MSKEFDYEEAFSRNIGWLTRAEQQLLRGKRVAIAGLGGVGGSHLLTLARLGVGRFHVADFDRFDLANFNRQAGATMSTLGRRKVDVLIALAHDINPEIEFETFDQGVHDDNVDEFLRGVDVYVDGLDFYAFAARKAVFDGCARHGLPAITVAPLGMGAALLNFMPGGMTFEQYFRWNGCSEEEMGLRFFVGLAPARLQQSYLVDPSTIDFKGRRGPSTPMGCSLCAGVAASEALKILLGRGKIIAAPRGVHFDAYRNRAVTTWRPGGNANPILRLMIALGRRRSG
ncbi:ThiF family adenylyltransferase [Accumulibacter sp.]|uniref:ThiF family adenylyltransferase n=1 Tax=Accumulibacter sp. TaxID=2053492 RepID=UPI0025CF9B5D|nr:ThiF family adenylyltransferase [Accumulibacter sp.]MCM8612265.1 ThiF family adenylyltransferase [Accumulibacter sp.]MCM8635938.1 ThiF family adenylyltransferase [Accumulibacter sp.]MCM8639453.1 ThiF family adenylyltransferase [Accumulibacter sp.]